MLKFAADSRQAVFVTTLPATGAGLFVVRFVAACVAAPGLLEELKGGLLGTIWVGVGRGMLTKATVRMTLKILVIAVLTLRG